MEKKEEETLIIPISNTRLIKLANIKKYILPPIYTSLKICGYVLTGFVLCLIKFNQLLDQAYYVRTTMITALIALATLILGETVKVIGNKKVSELFANELLSVQKEAKKRYNENKGKGENQ